MLSSEEISFSLPANKTVLSFLQMKRKDQLKSIDLGMKFINMGNHEIQAWNNEEWMNKQQQISDSYEEKINNYRELLKNQQNSMEMLKDQHKKSCPSKLQQFNNNRFINNTKFCANPGNPKFFQSSKRISYINW